MKVPSIPARADRRLVSDGRAVSAAAAAERRPSSNALIAYFQRLWWAELPLVTVFWRDMAGVGTVVNLAAIGLAVLAAAAGAATGVGLVIFMAPTPYNILLVAAVWRRADREQGEWAWPARIGAVVWLLLAFMV